MKKIFYFLAITFILNTLILNAQTNCPNLVTNGNFEAGNTGFTSAYPNQCTCFFGSYCVNTSPNLKCGSLPSFSDHTTGTGRMLIVQGGTANNSWTTTVSVTPNTPYTFSFWARNLQVSGVSLALLVNNTQVLQAAVTNSGAWTLFTFSGTTPTGVTSLPIAIRQTVTSDLMNYAIDDIVFKSCDDCKADFTFANTGGCLNFQFTNTTITPNPDRPGYIWNFGDPNSSANNTSVQQNPTHQFSSCGAFNVCLIVDASECRDTICKRVIVEDIVAPQITCPPTVTVSCSADTIPSVTGLATATDNCSTPTLSYRITQSGVFPCDGTLRRTWTATDKCGNTSSCFQIVFVSDKTPPIITCPANTTVSCSTVATPALTGTATATDNCGTAPTITPTDQALGILLPCNGVINRTWSAADACGNTSTCLQVITVSDKIPPTIVCPQNTIVNTNTDLCDYQGVIPQPTVSDNCDLSLTPVCSIVTTSGLLPITASTHFPKGVHTIGCIVQDDCGNSSPSCTFKLTVVDNQPPKITCPLSIAVAGSITPPSTICKAIVNGLVPTVTDNCPMTTIGFNITPTGNATPSSGTNDASGTQFMGTSAVTYTATDMAGNTASCSFNVVVTCEPCTANAGPDIAICAGECTTLTAVGGPNYTWNTGSTTASITVCPSVTTTYTVTVNKNGCTATDQVVVTVKPKLNIVDSSRTVCSGVAVNLTNLVVNYGAIQNPMWLLGSVSGSPVNNPTQVTPSVNTTYFLIGGNTSGCKDTAEIEVIIYCDSIFKGSVLPCGITPRYLSSLSRQGNTRGARTPVPSFPTTAIERCDKFDIYYEDRIPGTTTVPEGFDNATYGLDRRTTLCAVLTYVQSVFDFSSVPANAPIRLHVVQSHVPTYNPAPAGASFLAMAGPHFDNTNPNPQIIKGYVYEYTQSGVDPAVGQYHAELIVNFDRTFNGSTAYPINWHNPTGQFGSNCQYDLYSVLLHEIGHTLGWISYTNHDINHLPKSILAPNYNHFSGIDSLLYKGTVSPTAGPTTPLLVGGFGNKSINPTLALNSTALVNNDFWITPNAAPNNHPAYSGLYFNTYPFAEGSILSHLDDQTLTYSVRSRISPGDVEDYVMGPFAASGMYRRVLRDIEINTFGRLGYTIKSAVSTSPQYLNRPPYSKRMAGYSNFYDYNPVQNYSGNLEFSETVPADYTLVNSGTNPSVTINLSVIQATGLDLIDADAGDVISVQPNSLLNIRGCGNGGNNHNNLTLSSNNQVITFTPRANFYGKAQFGFRLFDGKEAGSYVIYTIDVQKGTNNTNAATTNLVLNGNFEEGSELRRLGTEEVIDNAQQRQYHYREGRLSTGINFSDDHPYSWVSNSWGPYGSGIHITDSWIQCSGNIDKSATGAPTSSGGVFWISPPAIPLVGQRYKTLGNYSNFNYFPLIPDVKKCSRYTLEFDYFANPPDFPNGANIPLTVGFTNNPTFPALPNLNFSYNYNFPVINGSWQHITIPFTYCGTLPANYLDLFALNEGRFNYFYIDNLDLQEDLTPYPLMVNITGSSPSLCPGQGMTLTGTATNTLCNTTYSWSNNGGTNPITTVSPTSTTTYNLTVNDGCRTETQPFTVVVDPASCTDTCKAAFTYVFTHSCGNVVFTNQSTGLAPLSYAWDFGDGTTSTAQNPTHQFKGCGSFNVCLTITAANGCTKRICQLVQIANNNVPPIITCPANTTVQCGATTPSVTGTATATDDCLTPPMIAYTDVITGTLPCNASIQRTWTARDTCGNTATCIQIISVRDNIAPTITCPQNLTVNTNTGQCYYTFPTLPVIMTSDNCDPTPSVSYTYINSLGITLPFTTATQFPKGINSIKITAKDACNNVSQACIFTLTVVDNEKPKITCPQNVSVLGTITPPSTLCKALVNGLAPSVTDNCTMTTVGFNITPTGNATPSSGTTDASGGSFTGTSTVIYTATDMAGNTATCAFNVLVTCNSCSANAGPDVTICSGQSTTLTAIGGPNYTWSTSATTASIIVSPTTTTAYYVAVTNNGCTAIDTVNVIVNPKPNAGADIVLPCNGTIAPTTYNFGQNGQPGFWGFVSGPSQASIIPITGFASNMLTPGVYLFSLTQDGCSDTVALTIPNCANICDPLCKTDTLNISTGFEPDLSPQPAGHVSQMWTVMSAPTASGIVTPTPANFVTHSSWASTYPTSTWISAYQFNNSTNYVCPSSATPCSSCEPFVYERYFCTCDSGNIKFDFKFWSDNYGEVELWNNNTAIPTFIMTLASNCSTPNTTNNATTPQLINLTKFLQAGKYSLRVKHWNTNGASMGVNIQGTLTGSTLNKDRCCTERKGCLLIRKYHDKECNGRYDWDISNWVSTDSPLSGWVFTAVGVSGSPSATVTTNAQGEAYICNLPAGTYNITETPQSGWMPSTPVGGVFNSVNINNYGVQIIEFGNCKKDTCTCGIYSGMTYRPTQGAQTRSVVCGDTLIASCTSGFNWTLNGNFQCGGNTACLPTGGINWVLRGANNAIVLSGNTSGSINIQIPSSVFNTTSLYTLSLSSVCGSDTCRCNFKINATSCPLVDNCLNLACTGNFSWQQLRNDLYIKDMVVFNGKLVVAGSFTTNGFNNIAQWDGASWTALGTGLNGSVDALAVHGGKLYAGGSFTSTGSRIAVWDGTSWAALGSGTNGDVLSLVSYGTSLIVGGSFTTAGGVSANNIASWDGVSTWSSLGTGTNARVTALGIYNGNLIVGGLFTSAGTATANRIASWNGTTWSSMGTGITPYTTTTSQSVRAILQVGTDLVVAGRFADVGGMANTQSIAKWNGTTWSPMATGLVGVGNTGFEGINDLKLHVGTLYVGGRFTQIGGLAINAVARWTGTSWLTTNATDQLVEALESYASQGSPACQPHSAGEIFINRYACTTPVDDINFMNFRILPNPNDGNFIIELPKGADPDMKFRVVDPIGRLLFESVAKVGSPVQTIQANHLPNGLYFLQVISDGKVVGVEKFVKQ